MLIVKLRANWRARCMEWMLAGGMLGWGLILWSSPEGFDRPYFAPLARMFPREIWATSAVVVGIIRLVSLFVNGAMPRGTPILRQIGCGFGLTVWSGLLFGALSQEWRAPGAAIYAMVFVTDALSLSFAANDGKVAVGGRS